LVSRWPEHLECEKFPAQHDSDQLCMDPDQKIVATNTPKPPFEPNLPKSTDQSITTKGHQQVQYHLIDLPTSTAKGQSSSSNSKDIFINRIYTKSENRGCNCQCSQDPMFQPIDKSVKADIVSVFNVSYCTYTCSKLRPHDQQVAKMLGFSAILALTSSFLVLVTFLLDPSRFDYPDRPTVYMHLCFIMVATVYLSRYQFGSSRTSCNGDRVILGKIDEISSSCLLQFGLLYFFTVSAFVWWALSAFLKLLSSWLAWSKEAIDNYAMYYHIIAWFLPLSIVLSIISLNLLEGDPNIGMCYFGTMNLDALRRFQLYPFATILIFGTGCLVLNLLSLVRVWKILKHSHAIGMKNDTLPKLIFKNSVHFLSFCLPLTLLVVILSIETKYRDNWQASRVCNDKCDLIDRNSWVFIVFDWKIVLLKHLLILACGFLSGIWYFSTKTFKSIGKLFKRCFMMEKNQQNFSVDDGNLPNAIVIGGKIVQKQDGGNFLMIKRENDYSKCSSVGYYRNFYDKSCHSQLLVGGSSSGYSNNDNQF